MYKIIAFIVILQFPYLCDAQKEDYIWVSGADKSFSIYNGLLFDFNNPPMEVQEHDNNIGIENANASICDKEGNLLMYMNGCAVMNGNFEMMQNGDSLGYNIFWEVFNVDCNIGYFGFQDNLILSDPENENNYCILHKPQLYNGNGNIDSIQLWHSLVDISKNGGLGKVIEKNLVLDNSKIFLSSYLTAINHTNGKDWWIIQAPIDDSVFHTYIYDEQGIRLDTIQNSNHYMTRNRTSASGTAKFSPDGTRYAWYNYHDQLHLYDFDRSTGLLSNHQHIKVIPDPDYNLLIFNSLEWSPNSRFIYTASSETLHQVDLWEENIQENGIRLIDTYNGTQDPFSTTFFLMAQAPDCKIYMCPTSGTRSYHVIHKPNELGTACNFVQNGLKLPQISNFGGMPNFPRFRVDEEDKCDPTLTSVFGDAVYYLKDLSIYPSPSDGRYSVQLPEGFTTGTLTIFDLDGNIIRQKEISNSTVSIEVDITSFPSGFYNVELYPKEKRDRVFWGTQVIKN